MNYKEAKKILPKKEFEAFESILANQLSRTSPTKLKHRVSMARKLRDKYRDLAHQQISAIRRIRTNEVDTDINDRRARLFQDIIDRLEDELSLPRDPSTRPPIVPKKKMQQQIRSNRGEAYDRKAMLEAKRRIKLAKS